MSAADRTVHASGHTGSLEIVRYDKAGKWYVEWRGANPTRRCVSLPEAVSEAVHLVRDRGGVLHLGRPGGSRFDAAVKDLLR